MWSGLGRLVFIVEYKSFKYYDLLLNEHQSLLRIYSVNGSKHETFSLIKSVDCGVI